MAQGSNHDYAGFWLRVVATVIDDAVLFVFAAAVSVGGALAGEMGFAASQALTALVWLFYWPVMESSARQATFGKMMMGLRVTDAAGDRLGFLRALARNIAKIISAIPMGIGFLMAGFTGRKQALHDMVAGTLVMRQGPSHFFKALAAGAAGLVLAAVGAWALFAYVVMPQMSKQFDVAMKEAMKGPAMNPVQPPPVALSPLPTQLPAPPAGAPSGAGILQTAAAPAASPAAAPAAVPAASPAAKSAEPPKSAAAPKPAAAEPMPAPKVEAAAPAEEPKAEKPRPRRAAAPRRPLASAPPPGGSPPPGQERPVFTPRYNDVMTAVMQRDRQGVTELLNHGWQVDNRSDNGMTPLMGAVVMRDSDMALLLLSRGADPNAVAGKDAVTPLALAQRRGDTAMVGVLQRAGAR